MVAARLRSLEEGASVATLFDEGDSRLTDSRAGILFNGISSNGLEANYAQGTADARRYIKEFEQREGGREALIFMLEHYRRSAGSGFENAGSIQEQIDRRTGVGRTRTTVDSEFRAHSH